MSRAAVKEPRDRALGGGRERCVDIATNRFQRTKALESDGCRDGHEPHHRLSILRDHHLFMLMRMLISVISVTQTPSIRRLANLARLGQRGRRA